MSSSDPAKLVVAGVHDLGPLTFTPAVRARDGGFSARWGDRSVWVFGDTILARPAEDQETWRSSTWCWTRDLAASDGLRDLTEPLDATGAPGEFLPFNAEEQAFNRAHFGPRAADCQQDCGARYALWPGPIVIAPGGAPALVFYSKVLVRPGSFNFQHLGTSIARWSTPEAKPDRGSDDIPLFAPREPPFGAAALMNDGWVFAFACTCERLSCPCRIGRVPIESAMSRASWRFWNGSDWIEDVSRARPVLDGAPMISIHHNPHLNRFLAVYSAPLSAKVMARTAPRPEGPWSDEIVLFQAKEPANHESWPYAGLAHPEFAAQSGRRELVTYYRETGSFTGEIRAVLVDVAAGP